MQVRVARRNSIHAFAATVPRPTTTIAIAQHWRRRMSGAFDAIVIGSGLGGLTAAALMACAGHKVLVLERNDNFGGAATIYRHGALAIEASLHEIDGLDAGDPKAPILRSLSLDRDVSFVDVGDLHGVRRP